MTENIEEKFRNYLELFWLRPENAMLCTFMSKAIEDFKFNSPSLDLACGDGLFTFYHLGGKLSDDYDFFSQTKSDKFTHTNFWAIDSGGSLLKKSIFSVILSVVTIVL